MGFFSGRVAFTRYRVVSRSEIQLDQDHLDRLAAHAVGRQRVASSDGVEVGWVAGDHILDTRFDRAKNLVENTLHFALRVDRQQVPGDLLRAYTQVELEGAAAANPSRRPSARQKREARAAARERLEQEASDGRFLRRKAYALLWDAQARELLVGSTALTVIDRLHTLFQQTFGVAFERLGAGEQAFRLAELRQQSRVEPRIDPDALIDKSLENPPNLGGASHRVLDPAPRPTGMQFGLIEVLQRAIFSRQRLQRLGRAERCQWVATPDFQIRLIEQRLENLRGASHLGRAPCRCVAQSARAFELAQLPHDQGEE